jgi:ribose transport system ATP-binding protein
VLELAGISKSFGGVHALRDVDFKLRAGEIHGLVGENGAGKSTMMKIIAGVHTDYAGEFLLEGRKVRFRSTRDALRAGIAMVHQELSLMPELSVAENVFLGTQPVSGVGILLWRRMMRAAREQLAGLGIDVDPRQPVGTLPIGLQQLIEIARVIFSGARITILDEPTSALSPPEIERLFAVLRSLRERGRSIIFISHFLEDVLRICDGVTVFRNGRKVASEGTAAIDKRWLIEQMIGRGHQELEEGYTGEIALMSDRSRPVILETTGLTLGRSFRNVSVQVRSGEVVGLYGYMGSGQLEFTRALFGKLRTDGGGLQVGGRPLRLLSTAQARRSGIAYVPESRRAMLFHSEPIYKNATISILDRISWLFLKPSAERRIASHHIERLRIRTPSPDTLLGSLSGGNQQKVAVAKWLTYPPKVLVLNEPTRGMDVGAKDDVIKIIHGLRDQGLAVLVVSTEPETVLSLADRILVMKRGEIVREFANEIVSKDRLLQAA